MWSLFPALPLLIQLYCTSSEGKTINVYYRDGLSQRNDYSANFYYKMTFLGIDDNPQIEFHLGPPLFGGTVDINDVSSIKELTVAANDVTVNANDVEITVTSKDFDLRTICFVDDRGKLHNQHYPSSCKRVEAGNSFKNGQCYRFTCPNDSEFCYCPEREIDSTICPDFQFLSTTTSTSTSTTTQTPKSTSSSLSPSSSSSSPSSHHSTLRLTPFTLTATSHSSSVLSSTVSSTPQYPRISYPDANPGLKNLTHTPITPDNVHCVLNQSLTYAKLGESLHPDDVTILSLLVYNASMLPQIESKVSRVKNV